MSHRPSFSLLSQAAVAIMGSRPEYKDMLQDSWQPLGTVTATSAAASFLDTASRPTRFYRVVLN